jgi:hypothetical protein
MRCLSFASSLSLALLIASVSASAGAATYGCVGADGKKTFSDRPCPSDAADASRRTAGALGYAAPRHGLTFGIDPLPGDAVDARCGAGPAPIDRPLQGACDAQRGDTACSRVLPVLCFKPGTRRTPAPASVDAATGRITWPRTADGPQLGASPALRGDSLASRQTGSQACQAALGADWRMAGIEDSASWGPQAQRHPSLGGAGTRLWVAATEAPANCWHVPPPEVAAAPTRPPADAEERAAVAELLKLRNSPEYARLSPSCRRQYDQLEQALRRDGSGALVTEATVEPLMAWLQQCSQPAR